MGTLLTLLTIMLVNLMSIKLFLQGDLTLYIHPRYIWFTVIMNGLSLVIIQASLILMVLKRKKSDSRTSISRASVLAVLVFTLAILGLFLPAKPLMSDTLTQRYSETKVTNSVCNPVDPDDPPKNFQDWDALLNTCNDPMLYRDQPINLEGFVYEGQAAASEDTFLLARFKISCCAVDAYPLVLSVQKNEKTDHLKIDQWVRVEGTMQPLKTSSGLRAVVEPSKVTKIPQPNEPYEFVQF